MALNAAFLLPRRIYLIETLQDIQWNTRASHSICVLSEEECIWRVHFRPYVIFRSDLKQNWECK